MSISRPIQSNPGNGTGTYTPNTGATSATLVGMPMDVQSTGGSSNLEVYDEGVLLTPAVSLFNFTGAGVAATSIGNAVTVNVPGGASLVVMDNLATPTYPTAPQTEGCWYGPGTRAACTGGAAVCIGDSAVNGGGSSVAVGNLAQVVGAVASTAVAIGYNSMVTAASGVALGRDTQATDTAAIAIGAAATAVRDCISIGSGLTTTTQRYNTAIGNNSTASGNVALAVGRTSLASGNNSVALGDSSIASGLISTACGSGAQAAGTQATSFGSSAIASANNTTAIGSGATSSAAFSVALGRGSAASATFASALGAASSATASTAQALGYGAVATATTALAVGASATADTASGVAVGYLASTNSIANSIVLNASGIARTPNDTAHALALGVNSASYLAGSSLGVTINGTNEIIALGGGGTAPPGYTSTPTAAGTTVLTSASTQAQYFTGVTTQAVTLPVVTTLANGWLFKIGNVSTGLVSVFSSGGNLITVIPGNGCWGNFTCLSTAAGTGVAAWNFESGIQFNSSNNCAVGSGAVSNGSGSITIGTTATNSGTNTISFGTNAVVSATQGIAIGASAAVSANNCIVIGASASSTVAVGTSIGNAAVTNTVGAISIGRSTNSNSVLGSIQLGDGAVCIDAAHSLGFLINTASKPPGSLGLGVNNASFQIPMYSSLYASTATAAGTTTLLVTDAKTQRFSGATTQTVVLPVATTLANGFEFVILNDSTGAVTVQSSGANTITTLAAAVAAVNRGGWGRFICVNTAGGTGVASWSYLAGSTAL